MRKNSIEDSQMNMDFYLWIIWYIWKARNDKLFKGTDRDPLELIGYAEGECNAWFTTNEPSLNLIQKPVASPQALRLENICFVNGSWTSTSIFSGCG